MSKIVAIKGMEGEKEVDYSALPSKDIDKKIKAYEKRFGSLAKFLRHDDCESSPAEDYLTLIDWECLLEEQKTRKRGKLSLIRGGKKKPR
ncbi:MAG TPA: hypothetical protein VFU31_03170 [Candidatus Binatia bacterium]|nr:hypothetical protein [Candidatus Binatia bacterium]